MYQLINSSYFYPAPKENREFDKVVLVVKDKDNNKKFQVVEKPVIEYYITKPNYWQTDPNKQIKLPNYIEKEKTIPFKCYYKDVFKSAVFNLGDQNLINYYTEAVRSKYQVKDRLKQIHFDYRLHGTDVNIQDYYMAKFLEKYPYKDNNYGITKVTYDIETDLEHLVGYPDPEKALAPVNLITLVDMNNYKVYGICLQYNNESFNGTMEQIDRVNKELKERYKDHPEASKLEYITEVYKEEIHVITRFFNLINEDIKPDFAVAWNGNGFDNQYLMNRIKNLGYDHVQIICPNDAPYKKVSYYRDTYNQDPADNKSSFSVSGYTVFLDAMNLYANLRKGQGKEESYALDFIGQKEVGESKDELTESFRTIHLNQYETFYKYGIQDTVMLALMEWKNKDIDTLYNIAMITNTRIDKAMSKTICLRNLAAEFYKNLGYCISNNRTPIKEKLDVPTKGAFVADSKLLGDIGVEILGKFSRFIVDKATDFDLSSLYPSIILALNISEETSLGKLIIKRLNELGEYEDFGYEYTNDYINRDYVALSVKWFNTPSVQNLALKYQVIS